MSEAEHNSVKERSAADSTYNQSKIQSTVTSSMRTHCTYPESEAFFEAGTVRVNPKIAHKVQVQIDEETKTLYKDFFRS